MNEDQTTRICLWASPRNISTALMYSFAQRSDTKVVDEPFYGFYLSHTSAKEYHPGAVEIMQAMENDGDKVIRTMMGPQDKPVVFYKNMTHHMLDLDISFTSKVVNIILTREPLQMINSFSKVVDKPKMKDVGYQAQVDLLNYFKKIGATFMVIDARDILLNPYKALAAMCRKACIEFQPAMLSWNAGRRKEDGIWAKYWYGNVHQSTGFEAYEDKKIAVSDALKPLVKQCEPLYSYLKQHFELGK
tara:strand:- start:124419 stop:125156 length:738 start_codon:yes stop_codon:yes gene_type:complete